MITNLVASVVVGLVTNVSERFPTHLVSDPCPGGPGYGPGVSCLVYHCHSEPDADPQVKWLRTTIKEVTSLVYTNGLPSQVISEVVKSDVEVELKKRVDITWIPWSTNDVPVSPVAITWTNGYTTNGMMMLFNTITNFQVLMPGTNSTNTLK